MRRRKAMGAVALTAAGIMVAAGCGGADSGGSSDKGGGDSSRGAFTFASGKDTTGKLQDILDKWNSAHADEKVKFIELSTSADDQRNAMVQQFQAKSATFDIVNADVVWTAEFAARGWLEDLTDKIDTGKFLPATVDTATYEDKLYAAPFTSDGGMLYYRKDLVKTPPKTWSELISSCSIAKSHNMGCYAGQFAQYEGLTVNASEAINSAGGEILANDGKDVAVDSPEAATGLDFLVNGFKQGYIPKAAITYTEEEGRRAFQQGKLLYLRNWPYVYNLAQAKGKDSVIQGKFAVAPLPGPDGPGASTLGGHNLALNAASDAKGSAIDFMKFMESPESQKALLQDLSLAPVASSLYDDPALQKQIPYLSTLKQSILKAQTRPVTPAYNAVTTAISKDVYEALQGRSSTQDALKTLSTDLQDAIQTG